MNRINILIFCVLVSSFVYGQGFETNLTISPFTTFESNKTTDNKMAFGFSGSVQEFYNFTDNFAIGSEIRYSFENYKFGRKYNGVSIPESTSYYASKLTLHSINIPLIFRIKTKSKWSLNIGYGLTYNLDYKTSIDFVYYDWITDVETKTEIHEKSVDFGSELSSHMEVGLGKAFNIKDLRLLTEIFYNHSFADITLAHGGVHGAEILYLYNINPRYLGFRIGIGL